MVSRTRRLLSQVGVWRKFDGELAALVYVCVCVLSNASKQLLPKTALLKLSY